jgi:hypothetical protein
MSEAKTRRGKVQLEKNQTCHGSHETLLCDSKGSSYNPSKASILCVFVWIVAFFRGLDVH